MECVRIESIQHPAIVVTNFGDWGEFCLGVLFSVQAAVAEEELPLPEGKNIKEWESISAALVAEKRFSEAIIYLDKILEQEPDNLKALTNKAGLLAQLGNFSKSHSLSNKVLEIDPDRLSALTNKAIALKMLNEYEKSFEVFTKILMIDPDNEKIKQVRASLLSESPTISTNDSMYDVHVFGKHSTLHCVSICGRSTKRQSASRDESVLEL